VLANILNTADYSTVGAGLIISYRQQMSIFSDLLLSSINDKYKIYAKKVYYKIRRMVTGRIFFLLNLLAHMDPEETYFMPLSRIRRGWVSCQLSPDRVLRLSQIR